MTLLLVVSLGAWIYASPMGADPDGNFHLASIWCGDGYKTGQCEPPNPESKDKIPKVVKVPNPVAIANGCKPGAAAYAASCTNELVLQTQMVETGYNNQGRLYPNGYYWVASHFVSSDVVGTVLKIRIMNVMLFAFLIIAANFVLPIGIKRSLNVTHLVFLMPLGFFLIASNNPSSWAISGLGTFWAFLYGFLTIKNQKSVLATGALTVTSATMATQARADSAAFIAVISVIVTAIVLIRSSSDRQQIYRRLVLPFIISILAFLAYTSAAQSSAISTGLLGDVSTGRDPLITLLWNLTRLPGLILLKIEVSQRWHSI